MSKTRGLVSKVIRFSAVDGPGNRLVIFLQGCNFDCINCHNPHTIGLCNACGICVDACPGKALRMAGAIERQAGFPSSAQALSVEGVQRVIYDETLCLHCDHCIAICPSNSNPRVRWMTIEEVLFEVQKVLPFISGITVSGGEATRQAEFVRELFTALKGDPRLAHLTAFIDSNGSAPLATWEDLLPVTDGVMVDLKALEPEIHRQLTGVTNDAVLATIDVLYKQGKLYEVRLLLIPGYNADPEQIRATAEYLATVSPEVRVRLIPFRKHGVRLVGERLLEPQRVQLEEARDIFCCAGFREIVVT